MQGWYHSTIVVCINIQQIYFTGSLHHIFGQCSLKLLYWYFYFKLIARLPNQSVCIICFFLREDLCYWLSYQENLINYRTRLSNKVHVILPMKNPCIFCQFRVSHLPSLSTISLTGNDAIPLFRTSMRILKLVCYRLQ